MPRRTLSSLPFMPGLGFALLAALLALLWFAGGSSRADALGQVVVRAGTWTVLVAFILFAARPQWRRMGAPGLFVLAAIVLVGLQLVSLPPSLWTALPGRDLLAQAAPLIGEEQVWRPLSMSPGATVNALSSLVVPFATLLLMAGLNEVERARVLPLLLLLVLGSALIGLLQFSGARFDHPLIGELVGEVSGTFANRNHFALFAAIGCLMALVWGFQDRHGARWKGPMALALLLLFGLIILASGSRTGMVVGALGIVLGLVIVRARIIGELRRLPRWAAIGTVAGTVAVLGTALALSITRGRALSLDRALSLGAGDDLRQRALPTVTEMTGAYFPAGAGFGTFDPVYRISEQTDLLSLTYFNRAHNDLLEVVLEGGIAGLLLLVAAIGWWLWMSLRAWRSRSGRHGSPDLLPRLGSAVLLLVLIASATDYPARTPMIMAVVVIAAVWLAGQPASRDARGA